MTMDLVTRLRISSFGDCNEAATEIERLRAKALQTEQNWAADWAREYDAVIEECAKIADDYAQNSKSNSGRTTATWIGEDIRALKDRSP